MLEGVDDLVAALGGRLRELRRARGLSLENLAAASGVSRSMISDVERGARSPTVLVLARLVATALGTTVARLLGEDRPARAICCAAASSTPSTTPTAGSGASCRRCCRASSSSSSAPAWRGRFHRYLRGPRPRIARVSSRWSPAS